MNFDPALLALLHEVSQWERLHRTLPYIAMEIQAHREKLRVVRENMLVLVHEYNTILLALSPEERKLFADRIKVIDKKVALGLTKLSWVSEKTATEFFYREVRKVCREGEAYVYSFKQSCAQIDRTCRQVGDMLLLNIEKKRVYEHTAFQQQQLAHQATVRTTFTGLYAQVQGAVRSMYDIFQRDSDEV